MSDVAGVSATKNEVYADVFFKNAIEDLNELLGDKVKSIHSRPIW